MSETRNSAENPQKITAIDTVKNESERKKMERHFEIFGKFVSEIKRDTVVEIKEWSYIDQRSSHTEV